MAFVSGLGSDWIRGIRPFKTLKVRNRLLIWVKAVCMSLSRPWTELNVFVEPLGYLDAKRDDADGARSHANWI